VGALIVTQKPSHILQRNPSNEEHFNIILDRIDFRVVNAGSWIKLFIRDEHVDFNAPFGEVLALLHNFIARVYGSMVVCLSSCFRHPLVLVGMDWTTRLLIDTHLRSVRLDVQAETMSVESLYDYETTDLV
jgi:hypothetical protein